MALRVSCHSSYVRFDILQRILSRLFGITVIHAMVITDIDDKIIRRSWEVRSNQMCSDQSVLLASFEMCSPCFIGKCFPEHHIHNV